MGTLDGAFMPWGAARVRLPLSDLSCATPISTTAFSSTFPEAANPRAAVPAFCLLWTQVSAHALPALIPVASAFLNLGIFDKVAQLAQAFILNTADP